MIQPHHVLSAAAGGLIAGFAIGYAMYWQAQRRTDAAMTALYDLLTECGTDPQKCVAVVGRIRALMLTRRWV